MPALAPISLLTCCAFYNESIPCISTNITEDLQKFFVEKMIQGNVLYEITDQPLHQPNLHVDEVLENIKMPIKIGQGGFIGIIDLPQFKQVVKDKFHDKETMCAIMITLPDKLYVICKTNGWVIYF